MKAVHFLPALSLVIVAPAAAQVNEGIVMRPPMEAVRPPSQDFMRPDTLVMSDRERARRTIEKLKGEKRELQARLKAALARPCPPAS